MKVVKQYKRTNQIDPLNLSKILGASESFVRGEFRLQSKVKIEFSYIVGNIYTFFLSEIPNFGISEFLG